MAQAVVGDAGEFSACIAGHQERRVCRVHLRDQSSIELSGRRHLTHHLGHTGSSKPLTRESRCYSRLLGLI